MRLSKASVQYFSLHLFQMPGQKQSKKYENTIRKVTLTQTTPANLTENNNNNNKLTVSRVLSTHNVNEF